MITDSQLYSEAVKTIIRLRAEVEAMREVVEAADSCGDVLSRHSLKCSDSRPGPCICGVGRLLAALARLDTLHKEDQ